MRMHMISRRIEKQIIEYYKNIPTGVTVYDAEARLVFMNDLAAKYFELEKASDSLGFSFLDDPNLSDQDKSNILNNDQFQFNLEFSFRKAHEKHHYVSSRYANKFLSVKGTKIYHRGRLMNYVFLIEDRTTEKALEVDLINKNEQLSKALQVGEIAVWDWEIESNSLFMTDNFFDWFDIDYHFLEEQFMSMMEYVHPKEQLTLNQLFRQAIQNKEVSLYADFRLKKNNNTYLWIRLLGEPVYVDKQISHFTGVMMNIDVRKRAKDKLRENEHTLNSLLENMVTAFAVHEMVYDDLGRPIDYRFLYINSEFEKVLGTRKEEVIGKTIKEITPGIDQKWIDKYGNVAKYGHTMRFIDYEETRKRHYEIVAYQTKKNQFAVLFTDVTDRVELEEILKHTEKMSAVGQLAGGIAHDFNNQLMIIGSFCQLLLERELDDVSKEYVDKIYNATNQSKDITKELLAFSKKGEANNKVLDMNNMVNRIKQIITYTFAKDILIDCQLEAVSPLVYGDESLIENALINLCINAKDASSPSRDMYITLKTSNIMISHDKMLSTDVLKPGHYIAIEIKDNGIGISEENLPKIFEPFFTTKADSGTGMGLAAVFGTAKRHEGGVHVDSQLDKGTSVTMFLPVTVRELPKLKQKTYARNLEHQDACILLVDDEAIICEVLSEFLTGKGYQVHAATSPKDAIELYQDHANAIDLVILDVIMPDMNGFDLLKVFVDIRKDTKAIFLSGYRDEAPDEELLKSHILAFVEKPVNLNYLFDMIEAYLVENS